MHPSFNPQPELIGETLQLRPLKSDDLEGLYAAASAPEVWAGHPASDRHIREVFEPYFQFLLESGTTLAVIDRARDRIIGCSRYYVSPDQPESISIGFTFLSNAYWGGAANFVMKRLMLDHAFETYPEVWLHIAPTNVRSQKATAKLGAEHMYDTTMTLQLKPARWMCFRIRKEVWTRVRADYLPSRA